MTSLRGPTAASSCLVCGNSRSRALSTVGAFNFHRCSQCGLTSSRPIPSADEIEAHYRRKFTSGNYETARRFRREYRRIHHQLADFVRILPGERVLDIGCFTGELLKILVDRGADGFGLELQTEAVAIANVALPGRVFQADVFGTSFPPGPYDVVTMMALVEHVVDPGAFLRRAHGLLKPGGRIYLQTPDAGSVIARLAGAHWPPLAPIEHIHIFTRPALARLLAESGYSDVHFKAHVKWLPVAYVYEMLANFGPEWQKLFKPMKLLLGRTTLPFYVGEMMVSARK